MRSDEEIERLVDLFPAEWRRWCPADGGLCGCMGCVSVPAPYLNAGLKMSDALTKEEIERWRELHPQGSISDFEKQLGRTKYAGSYVEPNVPFPED